MDQMVVLGPALLEALGGPRIQREIEAGDSIMPPMKRQRAKPWIVSGNMPP